MSSANDRLSPGITLADLNFDPKVVEAIASGKNIGLENEIKKERAKRHLLNFTTYTKPNYQVNWHHRLICNTIDDFLDDPNRNRLMIFCSPRRGKSEIVSRRLPAYYFGRFPDNEIILTSYAAELAQAMNRDTQRIIDDDKYRELFPETQLSSVNVKTTAKRTHIRTSDRFEIVGHEGKYRSAGVGGGITGMGASLALIDDPLKDMAEAMSPKRKQMIYEWYQSTLYTRLSDDGKIIIVLTRWAEDDLAGRLLKEAETNPEADQWEVVSLPEVFDPDHKFLHPLDPRTEPGEVLWPQRFHEAKVKKVKATVGSKVWASLYQQEPSPAGGTIFQEQWFQYFKELPELQYMMASWDCAFKDGKKNDFVVGGVWGVCGANKYLLYLIKEKMDIVATIKAMLKVRSLYPHLRYTLIEDKANGPAIISMLKAKIPGLIPFLPKESKEARASAVAPQFEAGNIWLPDKYYAPNRTSYPWILKYLDDYLLEFKGFPFAANDDQVDMTTQALIKIGGTPSWMDELVEDEKVAEENREEAAKREAYNRTVAEAFGWNIDESSETETGLPFKLGF